MKKNVEICMERKEINTKKKWNCFERDMEIEGKGLKGKKEKCRIREKYK